MKNSKTVLSALALASATLLAPSAFAGKIDNVNQAIELVNNQAQIEHLLSGGNAGKSFTDRYSFTTSTTGDLDAVLFPRSNNSVSALAISGFSLYDSKGALVTNAVKSVAAASGYKIDLDNLAAGSYFLQVNGTLASNAAVKYLAKLNFGPEPAAVSEPASAGLMLAGLGLLGAMARRRRNKARTAA